MGVLIAALLSAIQFIFKSTYGKILFTLTLLGIFYSSLDSIIDWGKNMILAKFGNNFILSGMPCYILTSLGIGNLINLMLSTYLSISFTRWAFNRLVDKS